jgi:uncharacterized protein DUF3310
MQGFSMITTSDELERFFTGMCSQRAADQILKEELINNPSHYQSESGMEAIDVIEAFDLNFNLGNCIKYILRAGKKEDELQDLKKALWYIKRQIKNIEVEENDE